MRHALNTLPRSRIDLRVQSHSLQFWLELCQLNVKHRMRSAHQPLACAVINGPKLSIGMTQNVGSSHGSKVCQRLPQFKPLCFQFPPMLQGEALKLMDHKWARTRSKVSYTNLHQWPMLDYAMLHCSNTFRSSAIATASTRTANEHIQDLQYKALSVNKLVSSRKQKTWK